MANGNMLWNKLSELVQVNEYDSILCNPVSVLTVQVVPSL